MTPRKPYSPPRLTLLASRANDGLTFDVRLVGHDGRELGAGVVELELEPVTEEARQFSGGPVRIRFTPSGTA